MRAAGCAKIFSEKASGARGDRAELARVIKRLQPGDVLVVTRLDRLAGNNLAQASVGIGR
jgi:DNA invertase Pin-like site-specific DNA recombinase